MAAQIAVTTAVSKPSAHGGRPTAPPRWYTYLTLDMLARVLGRSIFHPAIVLIFYLCLASIHKHKEPIAFYTLYWAAALALVESVLWLNRRIVYGARRKVDWDDEVVVVTGGGGGLGRVLVESLVRRGVSVAVLDVQRPDREAKDLMESGDLVWLECDVASEEDVAGAVQKIKEQLGRPTILINNAAGRINGLPMVTAGDGSNVLAPSQAARTMANNAVSHFNTLACILPHIQAAPNGGTIITISSILSHLAPASLADYAASKSAISSLHHTLTNEINSHPVAKVRNSIKTVLVEVGQMDTQLFTDCTNLPWYAHFFGPILEAKDVAKEIVFILDRGTSGVIRMPFYAKCMPLYAVMPGTLQLLMRWFSGIDRAINTSQVGVQSHSNGSVKSEAVRPN